MEKPDKALCYKEIPFRGLDLGVKYCELGIVNNFNGFKLKLRLEYRNVSDYNILCDRLKENFYLCGRGDMIYDMNGLYVMNLRGISKINLKVLEKFTLYMGGVCGDCSNMLFFLNCFLEFYGLGIVREYNSGVVIKKVMKALRIDSGIYYHLFFPNLYCIPFLSDFYVYERYNILHYINHLNNFIHLVKMNNLFPSLPEGVLE